MIALYAQIAATPAGEPDLDGEWYYFEEIEPTSDIQLNTQDKWQVKAGGRTGVCFNIVEYYINKDIDAAAGETLSHSVPLGYPVALYSATLSALETGSTTTKTPVYVFEYSPSRCAVCDTLHAHDASGDNGYMVPSPLRVTFSGIQATEWYWPGPVPGELDHFDQAFLDENVNDVIFDLYGLPGTETDSGTGEWQYWSWSGLTYDLTSASSVGDIWIKADCKSFGFETTGDAYDVLRDKGWGNLLWVEAWLVYKTGASPKSTPIFSNRIESFIYNAPSADISTHDVLPVTGTNGLSHGDIVNGPMFRLRTMPAGDRWAGWGGNVSISLPWDATGCLGYIAPSWWLSNYGP
jgi:hypothetical protein